MRLRKRKLIQKFFADRGTHLAAMIAYFALLSFVPLLFVTLSLLGLVGRADESSYLVKELKHVFPEASVSGIVKTIDSIRSHATALGIIGGVALLWTSLSLFSVLESACNIVYGRPNRSFLHGKLLALVLMIGSTVTLWFALLVGSLGVDILRRYGGGWIAHGYAGYSLSILVSLLGIFVFLFSVYYLLTNAEMTVRGVLPGAIAAAVLLEATFQVLPLFLKLSKHVIALQALGAPALLLVWLYVMANFIVLGAEVNWWFEERRGRTEELAGGLA
ncbi:MAG: rane protein [Gaiellaceae bacterium]|jgi:membrane protein|nr:rane protein [Gaiellaceae bacterium]